MGHGLTKAETSIVGGKAQINLIDGVLETIQDIKASVV